MLVFAEDAVDEIYEVLRTTFRGHRNLASAYRFLAALLHLLRHIGSDVTHVHTSSWVLLTTMPCSLSHFSSFLSGR